jgi:type II secretory pathway pseudopilin PulG
MKRQWIDNGATFLEIVIALAILALIAAPFMSAFIFSERGTVEAGEVLDSTFLAQRRLEQLQSLDFRSAVDAGNRVKESFEDAYVEVSAVPYHPANTRFFNLVVQDASGRNLYITTPTGGEARSINTLTGNVIINLNLTASGYTVTVPGSTPLSGTMNAGGALIQFNATRYTGNHNITLAVTLSGGRTLEAHVYDTHSNSSRIIVSGATSVRRFTGFTNRNFSMLRARVSVFEFMADTAPKAVMESIFELAN